MTVDSPALPRTARSPLANGVRPAVTLGQTGFRSPPTSPPKSSGWYPDVAETECSAVLRMDVRRAPGAAVAPPQTSLRDPSDPTTRAGHAEELVPVGAAARHLRILQDCGMSLTVAAEISGVSQDTLVAVLHYPRRKITAQTHARLMSIGFVPRAHQSHTLSLGAHRRVQALAALGWDYPDLAAQCGLATSQISSVPARGTIATALWVRIAQVYEELSMTIGPAPRMQDFARALGWAPPLAWDDEDIDDPHGHPRRPVGTRGVDEVAVQRVLCGDRSISLSRDEQRLITEHAEQRAWSDERLAETLQMSVPTVMRRRGRIRLTHRVSAAR